MEQLKEELLWDFTGRLFLKLSRISELCVLVKKEKEHLENLFTTKDQVFIELFQDLCVKEEISQTETALVENPFMEPNSRMRTSKSSTRKKVFSQWQMLEQTQTGHNFSLL